MRSGSGEEVLTLCLAGNVSVVSARADLLLCQGRVLQAYKLTSGVIRKDLRSTECMATHLACLVELGKKNELFKQAHRCTPSPYCARLAPLHTPSPRCACLAPTVLFGLRRVAQHSLEGP